MSPYANDYFHFKSIRDPLYGFIDLSETEIKLIDTLVFRRLQGIKQLSHAYLVYPTAIHTRFEHALGVMHLADRVAQRFPFDDSQREIIRLAGLLHDVGHGPFSHLFEDVMEAINGRRIDHDKISMMLIKEDPDMAKILGDSGMKVIQLLNRDEISGFGTKKSALATDIIASSLDVDKMDYLRRDSYHIGVHYGQFDLPRIIHTLTHTDDSSEQRICVRSKGKDAIESYRLGRYLMHAQVYRHHTRLAGDRMFFQALDLAVNKENIIPKDSLRTDTDLDKDHGDFLDFYTKLDDRSLYDRILAVEESDAAKILKRIQRRDLLKPVVECLLDVDVINAQNRNKISRMNTHDLQSLSCDIAEYAGTKAQNVIAYLSTVQVNLYDGEILVMWKGVPRTQDELSPIGVDKATFNKFYVFGPDEEPIRKKIIEYVKERLGIVSVDHID